MYLNLSSSKKQTATQLYGHIDKQINLYLIYENISLINGLLNMCICQLFCRGAQMTHVCIWRCQTAVTNALTHWLLSVTCGSLAQLLRSFVSLLSVQTSCFCASQGSPVHHLSLVLRVVSYQNLVLNLNINNNIFIFYFRTRGTCTCNRTITFKV